MDEKVTFRAHRQAVAKKIANNCGVLFRARHVLNKGTLKSLYYSFIQSHIIYCSSVWGLGSKNSLQNIFVSQKRAIRTMTFTKLYKKDKLSGIYTYGHTKPIFKDYELLSIHNLVLTQALNLMHRIKMGLAPRRILKLFNVNKTTKGNTRITLSAQQVKRLNRLNIEQDKIITRDDKIMNFFEEPHTRLNLQKYSLADRGPRCYNYFVNVANTASYNVANNIKHERLFLNGFKNRIKNIILKIQSFGDEVSWEPQNHPLYTLSNRSMVLHNNIKGSAAVNNNEGELLTF